jgi:hypothetical protein
MILKGNYYNFNDSYSIHGSMLRPEVFTSLEDSTNFYISTYQLGRSDYIDILNTVNENNLILTIDCSTEILPPIISNWIANKTEIFYNTFESQDTIDYLKKNNVKLYEIPYFLKYMNYYTPIYTNIISEKKPFLFLGGKPKYHRICLLGLLSYYGLLDYSFYSVFGENKDFYPHTIDDYFNTNSPENQKEKVTIGLSKITIPTILDVSEFNYTVSHTREFNADYYSAVDFVLVTESDMRDNLLFITEKISKCILLDKKFIVLGSCGIIKYTKEQAKIHLGKDISHLTDWCDTSYDDIEDVWKRIGKVVEIINDEVR